MPQSTVFSILQDSRGYLWLGTDGAGISRFDGINFKTYNKKQGLAGNIVRSIMEDNEGNLWIGTDEGISVYNGLKITTINHKNGLSGSTVLKLYQDAQNNIWAGTNDGGLNKIKILNNDSIIIKSYTKDDGLGANWIFDIFQDKHKRLWLALYGGIDILTFSNEKIKIQHLEKDQIPSDIITTIEQDNEGNLWFGTFDAGAFKIINKSNITHPIVITYNTTNGLNDNKIWDILSDNKGVLWFATDKGGINKYAPDNFGAGKSGFKAITKKHGLPDNQILSIYQDVEQNIWLATMGNGFSLFMGEHFSHFTNQEGLPDNKIFDIEQDKKGDYWLATNDGLTKLSFNNNKPVCINYSTNNGLINNSVKSLAISPDGNLWIATEKGISKYDGQKFTNYSTKDGLIDNWVNCIFADFKDDVWIGTPCGISKFDGNKFINIDEDKGLINNEVQTIIQDKKGNIWFGTLGGLAQTDGKIMITYDEIEGLYNKKIYSLAEDQYGNIWIGTFGGGLYKFNINSQDSMPVQFIIDNTQLSSNNIYSLIFHDKNTLIVGTDRGFDILIFDKSQNIINIRHYNKSNGFIGVENNLNSICKDNKGNIWFGTVKGATRYNSSIENINLQQPKTHITGLKLFFEEIDWSEKSDTINPWFNVPYSLNLPYYENHLTFNFSAGSLINPERILYKYKLEGGDDNWSPAQKEDKVIYPGLSPGNYVFKVIAANENGIWNTNPFIYSFTIKPPFWQTIWFYIVCSLLILSFIIAFIKFRERKLVQEKIILENKVAERTSEVVAQKQVIEQKNIDIMDSINYAKRIQEALLPPDKFIKQFIHDSFILHKPKDIVSGDFYWIEKDKNKILFSAVDCTGHGVPGAFMSIIGHNGLNRSLKEYGLIHPAEIMDKLNDIVAETLRQTENVDVKDGMDMALCVYTPLNPPYMGENRGVLEFAGANNPLYLINPNRKEWPKEAIPFEEKAHSPAPSQSAHPQPLPKGGKKRDGNLSFGEDLGLPRSEAYRGGAEIKGNKQPIGAFDNRQNFSNHQFNIHKGDTIYIFSDGFADQFGGPKGKKFKYKQFKQLLMDIQEKTMKEQEDILAQTLEEWKGDLEQLDDICIIGVRF